MTNYRGLIALAALYCISSFSADTSVQLQYARVADESLECKVSKTTVIGTTDKQWEADLTVSGFSNAPAIWDKTTRFWKDIKNEPLFLIGESFGGESKSTSKIQITLMHKVYDVPAITNIMMANSAIGTVQDEPFHANYKLVYYSGGKGTPTQVQIQVNGYRACTVVFGPKQQEWSVLP